MEKELEVVSVVSVCQECEGTHKEEMGMKENARERVMAVGFFVGELGFQDGCFFCLGCSVALVAVGTVERGRVESWLIVLQWVRSLAMGQKKGVRGD